MAPRKDFLRHIVNRVLASSKLPRQIVEDIRRMVGRAEDKYKFHAFGGDVRRLADYLKSQDFNELVSFLKNVRVEKGEESPIDVLRKILLEAREAYKDVPEIVAAIDEKLKELESETSEKKSKIELLYEDLSSLKDKYGVDVSLEDNRVVVKYQDRLEASISYNEETRTYTLSYSVKDEASFDTLSELKSMLRRLVELVRGKPHK